MPGIQNLTGLTVLNLAGNDITDIGALSELSSLTMLDLGSNSITDISTLSGLTSLIDLHLDSNHDLADIQPLLDNTGLGSGDSMRWVRSRSTNVRCEDVAALEAKGVVLFSDCLIRGLSTCFGFPARQGRRDSGWARGAL